MWQGCILIILFCMSRGYISKYEVPISQSFSSIDKLLCTDFTKWTETNLQHMQTSPLGSRHTALIFGYYVKKILW